MSEAEELEKALTESVKLRTHYQSLLPVVDQLPPDLRRIAALRRALDEAVALQTLYARLVNFADGGQRQGFRDSDAWIARLRETGTLPPATR